MEVIGKILVSAYFEDQDFRDAIKPINMFLSGKCQEEMKKIASRSDADYVSNFQLVAGIQSTFYNYIISSFHAARACELFNQEAVANSGFLGNYQLANALMILQHAHGLEALFNLSYAKNYLTNRKFSDIVGTDLQKTKEIFDSIFAELDAARDALAHQEERALGIIGLGERANRENAPVNTPSMRGSTYQGLIKRRKLENDGDYSYYEFDFSFSTSKYFELALKLSEIFR